MCSAADKENLFIWYLESLSTSMVHLPLSYVFSLLECVFKILSSSVLPCRLSLFHSWGSPAFVSSSFIQLMVDDSKISRSKCTNVHPCVFFFFLDFLHKQLLYIFVCVCVCVCVFVCPSDCLCIICIVSESDSRVAVYRIGESIRLPSQY